VGGASGMVTDELETRLISLFNNAVSTDMLKSVQRQDGMRNETDVSVLGNAMTSNIKRTGK
jgi:hypothetical protein